MSAHPSRRAALPEMTERLRQKALKITGPRRAILDALHRQNHPLSSKELFQTLGKGDCDLATIYRSLHLLESVGLVQRFDFGDGIARYEMVAAGHDEHHHHLVCVQCSAVVEIEDCFPRELEEEIARRNGFQRVTHRLEFFGVCPQCVPAAPEPGRR